MYKIHNINMYTKYKKKQTWKYFFHFCYNTLTLKLDGNTLAKKNCHFFQLESFVDKTIFHFHSFNKVNDIVTTQYATTIFYQFYLNPLSQFN